MTTQPLPRPRRSQTPTTPTATPTSRPRPPLRPRHTSPTPAGATPTPGSADDDRAHLPARILALRREGLSRSQIASRLGIRSGAVLDRALRGEPAPEWTHRPNAKDHLRERARELRREGRSYDEIQRELRVSRELRLALGEGSAEAGDAPRAPSAHA